MKKKYLILISAIVCVFLFIACRQIDIFEFSSEKAGSDSTITADFSDDNDQGENNNDQGEDEGNGKKPPVVEPPETDPGNEDPVTPPTDNFTVSVSIDYEPNSWVADILVMLTLSDGEWDNFILTGYEYMNGSVTNAFLDWIDLSFVDALLDYCPALTYVAGGYEYIISAPDNALNRINPKVLTFRFSHGYPHIALGISKGAAEEQFSRFHLPVTVTLNEKKLDEMKSKTNITGDLTIGTKSAVMDKLKGDLWEDWGKVKSIPFHVGAAENHMSSTKGHNLFTIVRSKEELNLAAETRYHQYWTDGGGLYNVYYLAEITEKYDDDFFVQNALVLYLFSSASGGGKIDITQMQRQGHELTMSTDFLAGLLGVVSYWTVVIEVAQADVYGITSLIVTN